MPRSSRTYQGTASIFKHGYSSQYDDLTQPLSASGGYEVAGRCSHLGINPPIVRKAAILEGASRALTQERIYSKAKDV